LVEILLKRGFVNTQLDDVFLKLFTLMETKVLQR